MLVLSFDPFLKIGITLADFSMSGYTPVWKDRLNMIESGWLILSLSICRMIVGILHGPTVFLGLIVVIMFRISTGVQSKKAKVFSEGLVK